MGQSGEMLAIKRGKGKNKFENGEGGEITETDHKHSKGLFFYNQNKHR